MGLLTGILLLPLAPVRGTIWVAEQLAEQAARELDEEVVVRRLLVEAELELDRGALTARHRDGEDEPAAEDDEPLAEREEEPADEDEPTMPEAEADGERRDDRRDRDRRERKAADLGQVERAVQAAREQLRQLSGTEAETVSSFAHTRDGWRVTLEVVEVRRIPETTDVLASYAVELDDDGNLVAYERVRRYQR